MAALYPGDGIGVEVIREAMRVLRRAQELDPSWKLETTELDWGCAYFEKHGRVAPADYLKVLAGFDAIFLGALGWPAKVPDHITIEPLLRVRQAFDQYACVRPAKLFPGVRSPLSNPGAVDMLVVRENSEGEYVNCGAVMHGEDADGVAIQTAIHSRRGIERILRFGFEAALKRPRKHLTMITKSNALKHSMIYWDQVLEWVKGDYPGVTCDKMHVDAAAMEFVRRPERFDVVVASNLFGDILTDLSGAITGSLGLNPSGNLDPQRRFPSLFEPVHGSAPDIAGKGIANPIAAILAGAMMLDWLGAGRSAEGINRGVERALAKGGHAGLGGAIDRGRNDGKNFG